ncbi:hypothetical protein [Rhodococcoides fascians]|uniref:hypothetical protein n=1 Tax=Rhodococcoides fascians TaxID=1828 RepID=UPI0037A7ABB9
MSGGEFAAIEARANAADDSRGPIDQAVMYRIQLPYSMYDRISRSQCDVRELLAAVRERDNTIAKVHELMQSWDNGDYDDMNQFSPHHFVRHLRAALDPQETP